MKTINVVLYLCNVIYKVFRSRGRNSLLFIPHHNCLVDRYDVFNGSSDNVLCLFNSVMQDDNFNDYDLELVYYHPEKKAQYEQYLRSFKRAGKCHLVYFKDKLRMIFASMRFRVCFIAESYRSFPYKTKDQKVISLGYFTPFKSDQNIYIGMSETKMIRRGCKINKSIDYEISTSDLSSRILSSDSLLFYRKFLPLGFPRNDIFYIDNSVLRKSLINKMGWGSSLRYIICYTPTFRDYERIIATTDSGGENKAYEKTLFGNHNPLDDLQLESLLNQNNSIIVVKSHSWQNTGIMLTNSCKHIVNYADIIKDANISLYDIMAISDCLITDYTSAVFDYLHGKKPVVYYFYDYDKYKKSRGFSYYPIESFCPGPIAYTFEQLVHTIDSFFSQSEKGKDEYKVKRNYVHNLFNTYQDGNSCNRIKQFVKGLT